MRSFGPYLDGYWDVQNQLIEHLKRRAARAASLEAYEKEKLASVADFEQRRKRVREAFMQAIGGIREAVDSLNAKTTGRVVGNGFCIEKLIFESLPGMFVTANLYLPNASLPAPAILFVCGHTKEGKAYPPYQQVALDLVNAGFVVMVMDPIGQGERMQYVNQTTGGFDVDWGIVEHSHAGLQCTIAGQNIARYFVIDGMRALDYLCQRPEVNPERIGITGNSGGGTQSSYLMMVDDRLAAAFPCTYINCREQYLQTGQPHDAEQNLYGALSQGINYDDFLTALAPKPVQLGAVASDFFPIEGALQSAMRAEKVYALYGAAQNFRYVIAPGRHEYAPLLRREAVNWFRHHLMGDVVSGIADNVVISSAMENPDHAALDPSSVSESTTAPLPEKDLWCTKSGELQICRPAASTVFCLLNRHSQPATTSATSPKIQDVVHRHRNPGPIWARSLESGIDGGIHWEKVFFFSEPDIAVSGVWAWQKETSDAWLVLLEDGTDAVHTQTEVVAQLIAEKGKIFLFDPRGVGAVKQRPLNNYGDHTFGTEFVLNYNAMMLEDSLLWMRAYDVVKALTYITGVCGGRKPSLYAEGWLGLVGLAAVETFQEGCGVQGLEFDRLLYDVRNIVEERLHDRNHRREAFNLLALLDIPGILKKFGDRVTVRSWIDAQGQIVAEKNSP